MDRRSKLITIRELRESAGLTQAQLAARLDLAPATVYAWEARKNEPRASQLRALAKLFGVSMDDIDFESNSQEQKTTT